MESHLQIAVHTDFGIVLDAPFDEAHWVEIVGVFAPDLLNTVSNVSSDKQTQSTCTYRLYAHVEATIICPFPIGIWSMTLPLAVTIGSESGMTSSFLATLVR